MLTSCSMCGSAAHESVTPLAWDALYLRCNACGHEREVQSSYHDQNEPYYEDDSHFYFSPFSQWLSRATAKQRIRVLKRYLRGGRILEIGPGSGQVMQAAADVGFDISAVENSQVFVKRLRSVTQGRIYHGFFDHVDFEGATFQGLLSFHVIEHLADPASHLRRALQVTDKGGYLLLATPNTDSWDRRFCREKWTGYSLGHVNLFSANSLTSCLERSGWEVVEVSTVELPWQLLWSLKVSVKPKRATPDSAGSNVKRIPLGAGAAALTLFGVLTKPFRVIQELSRGGNELFIVARRPDSQLKK